MWFKYLIISVFQQKIKIGMKFNDKTNVCIIGGQKRYVSFMLQVAENYFGANREKIIMSYPQTYKIRLTFDCTEEMVQQCRNRMRDQTEFQLIEVADLDRTMR